MADKDADSTFGYVIELQLRIIQSRIHRGVAHVDCFERVRAAQECFTTDQTEGCGPVALTKTAKF